VKALDVALDLVPRFADPEEKWPTLEDIATVHRTGVEAWDMLEPLREALQSDVSHPYLDWVAMPSQLPLLEAAAEVLIADGYVIDDGPRTSRSSGKLRAILLGNRPMSPTAVGDTPIAGQMTVQEAIDEQREERIEQPAPTVFDPPVAFRPDPPRSGNGQYLIQVDPSRKALGYQRATTVVKPLDDTYNLTKWMKRNVAKGLVMKPSLLSMVSAHLEDNKANKTILDGVCNDAEEAAGSTTRRDLGIALHALAQQFDAGVMPQFMSVQDTADLGAYAQWRVDNGIKVLSSELVVVHDDIQVAGTFDRIYEIDGKRYIGDLKTGTSVELGLGTYAAQMALYARGTLYSYPEGCTCSKFQKPTDTCAVVHERTPMVGVETDRALIVHLPAGEARCEGYWVDLDIGWAGVQLALGVKAYRKAKVAIA